MNVDEMFEVLKKAKEEGKGELDCFGTDEQGMSYEVSTSGLVRTPRYIEGGPLLEEKVDKEYFSFSLEY